MFSSRLPDTTMRAIEARAAKRGLTKTEALASLVEDALDMRGREGLEARVAAMQATIDEQDRIITKQTGKRTPRTKRLRPHDAGRGCQGRQGPTASPPRCSTAGRRGRMATWHLGWIAQYRLHAAAVSDCRHQLGQTRHAADQNNHGMGAAPMNSREAPPPNGF